MDYAMVALVLTGISLIITSNVKKVNIIDKPNERKLHKRPIPKAGGLGIFIPFLLGMIWFIKFHMKTVAFDRIAFVIVTALFVVVGIIDDKVELKARYKLLFQIVFTCISMYYGLMFKNFGWFNIPITFLWYIGIINGVNLIDGLDGLAGGIGIISSLSFGFIGLLLNHSEILVFSLFLTAGCLGFLVLNFHPAKIFMGDTGSLPLGFVLASLGVIVSNVSVGINSLLLPGFVLFVPIYDTLLTMIRRKINSKPLFAPDKEHFYNLLMDIYNINHCNTVILIYFINILFADIALLFLNAEMPFKLLTVFLFAFITIYLSIKLGFVFPDRKQVEHSHKKVNMPATQLTKNGI